MTTHSSILAWKIPWTEELCRLQSMELQRVRHHWAHTHAHTHILTPYLQCSSESSTRLPLKGLWEWFGIADSPPEPGRQEGSAFSLPFYPAILHRCCSVVSTNTDLEDPWNTEGQGSLVCCSSWGPRVGHDLETEQNGFRLEAVQSPWCLWIRSVRLNFLSHLTTPSPVHPSPRHTLAYTHLWGPRWCLNLVRDFGPYLFLQSIKLLSLFLKPGKLLSYHVVLLLCSLDISLINSQFYMFQDKCCWNIKHTVFLWSSHSRKCGFKTVTSADLI